MAEEKSSSVTYSAEAEFVITRVFNAPRELVFKAWTESERLAQWWGPRVFTILVSKLDPRPDGVFPYRMRSPGGRDMWGKFVYREIVAPERIVFVNSLADETGNSVRNYPRRNWSASLSKADANRCRRASRERWTSLPIIYSEGLNPGGSTQGGNETMKNAASTGNRAERQVVITRVFDAPRELVFQAWTDPRRMAQWWGPHRFTNPVCELDARPGGAWRIVMRGPGGVEYPCGGVYREVVKPERLVFTNNATDQNGNPLIEALTTVTFAEHDGKTKLTLHTRAVALVPEAVQMIGGMEEGWTQSLERLGERIAVETGAASTAAREIVTTRVFDAPRELVFEAWTDPEHVAQWWGPNGFTNTIHEMDVRPGGVWRFVMHGPDGVDYNNKIVYIEVVKPERLVYSHVSSPQFQATVTFDEQDGRTTLTMRTVFETVEEHDRVVKVFGAVEGAKQTLGRLAQFLAMKPEAGRNK